MASDPNHTYPPGYQPPLDEQQIAYLEHLFQTRIAEVELTHQQRYENQQAAWQAQLEENRTREHELAKQVEELQAKLSETQLNPVPEPKGSSLSPSTPRRSTRQKSVAMSQSPRASPKLSRPAPVSTHVPPAKPKSMGKISTPAKFQPQPSLEHPQVSSTPTKTSSSSTPRKPAAQVYRLLAKDVPKDAISLKSALELHIRILWGYIEANSVPPTVDPSHLSIFRAHFTDDGTENDLRAHTRQNVPLVDMHEVRIGSNISPATQKRIASNVKRIEDFILNYVQMYIAKFGLVHWCPDLSQTPYSVYNSACRIIALDTFVQAMVSHAYDHLQPARRYMEDMELLAKLYNHFVHHTAYETYKKELRSPGSVETTARTNPVYQARLQLALQRKKFLERNRYPARYIQLIDVKGTSDDEVDPTGLQEDRRPVYWIKRRPERSAEMEQFIRKLDEKREEENRYNFRRRGGQKDRIRRLPDPPQDTTYHALPQNIPIDYFDPSFFNGLQPDLRQQIASPTIALLPNIKDTFTHCPDEQLTDDEFMEKYGQLVLSRYKIDDLDGEIDEDEQWLDDEENEFVDDMEM